MIISAFCAKKQKSGKYTKKVLEKELYQRFIDRKKGM